MPQFMNTVNKAIICIIVLVYISVPALAMTKERAIERVKETDPSADSADEFYVYPDRDSTALSHSVEETDGAWVFYIDGENGWLFSGQAWFVSENMAIDLGRSDSISYWNFLSCSTGNIFTSRTEPNGRVHCHAWTLVEGEVVKMDTVNRIFRLGVQGDCLYAETSPEIVGESGDYDLAFMCMNGGILQEVSATPMSREQFSAFDGASEILAQIEADGYVVDEILFRFANPEIDMKLDSYTDSGGVAALNVSKDDGSIGHIYVFIERNTHRLFLDNEFFSAKYAVYSGIATPKRDVGYHVIETVIK